MLLEVAIMPISDARDYAAQNEWIRILAADANEIRQQKRQAQREALEAKLANEPVSHDEKLRVR